MAHHSSIQAEFMLPSVQVTDKSKLRWFGHEERGRVNAEGCDEIKDEGKIDQYEDQC